MTLGKWFAPLVLSTLPCQVGQQPLLCESLHAAGSSLALGRPQPWTLCKLFPRASTAVLAEAREDSVVCCNMLRGGRVSVRPPGPSFEVGQEGAGERELGTAEQAQRCLQFRSELKVSGRSVEQVCPTLQTPLGLLTAPQQPQEAGRVAQPSPGVRKGQNMDSPRLCRFPSMHSYLPLALTPHDKVCTVTSKRLL